MKDKWDINILGDSTGTAEIQTDLASSKISFEFQTSLGVSGPSDGHGSIKGASSTSKVGPP